MRQQVAVVQAELSTVQTEVLNRKLALATVHPSLPGASSVQTVNCSALQQAVDFIDIDHSLRGPPPPLLPIRQQLQQEEEKDGDSPIMDVPWENRNSSD
jgi:LOB domain-containing protein 18